ncbi:flagellar motor switch protein FliN [Microbacterium sp. 77mftsu3.1]|uniref:flagellar motor switch protein FliN n=1 Tax=Microbacterium sp. 77mftsu3.1 TaxID=1761802 RepID=UPI000377D230|nr:flagellar motor switch protein FliN [Microbacterium sp. 77mftsu3.1]SDH36189.1 flagellar motor switch protein FliN/FliY [Microbacterium sp. 77mftsu3.1]
MTTPAHESAAAAFADRLPTAAPTTVRPAGVASETGDAVVISAIGETSADIAVIILDEAALADGSESSPISERLHTALEAAAGAIGPGTFGAPQVTDASGVFADPTASVYDLLGKGDKLIGRLAVRITRTGATSTSDPRWDRIKGVELDLTVEVGRTRMTIGDVNELKVKDVIELDRSAGAPADIKINNRLVAHGEIVVVDQDYAVRITRIIDPSEG